MLTGCGETNCQSYLCHKVTFKVISGYPKGGQLEVKKCPSNIKSTYIYILVSFEDRY